MTTTAIGKAILVFIGFVTRAKLVSIWRAEEEQRPACERARSVAAFASISIYADSSSHFLDCVTVSHEGGRLPLEVPPGIAVYLYNGTPVAR